MKTSKEIRKAFLDFFTEKEHQIVNSAPMVVKGDPDADVYQCGDEPV